MTLNEKVLALDNTLRGKSWYLATGLDATKPEIIVYASSKANTIPDQWEGVKVVVKVMGKSKC